MMCLSAVSFTNIFENFNFHDLFLAASAKILGFKQLGI